jgi:hypothetical protein
VCSQQDAILCFWIILSDYIGRIKRFTGKDFGLKVRSHPDTLIVTARNKMGTSENVRVKVGLGNRFIETTTLSKKPEIIESNRSVAKTLVANLGPDAFDPNRPKGNYLWKNVNAQQIIKFVGGFNNHPNSFYTESEPVVQYIEQRAADELKSWDVVVINTKEGVEDNGLGLPVRRQLRTESKKTVKRNDYLVVSEKQRIGDAGMESIGMNIEMVDKIQRDYSGEKTAEYERQGKPLPKSGRFNVPGRKYREVRKTPLLIVHLLSMYKPELEGKPRELSISEGVAAWSISFPETNYEEETVEYVVNTTWWKENFGDDFDEDDADDE